MEYNPKQFYCFKLKNIMKNCVEKYQGTFRCRQIIDNYNKHCHNGLSYKI